MKDNPWISTIAKAATQYGIDPALLAALIQQESGFNPKAKSGVGAMGMTQLMPGTAQAMGVKNPYDPVQSIMGGAKYFAQKLKKHGSEDYALAAYNGGDGAVDFFKGHGGIYYNPKAAPDRWANQTGHYVRTILGNRGGMRDYFARSTPVNPMTPPPQPQAPMMPPPLPTLPVVMPPEQQATQSLIDGSWFQ